MRHAKAEPAGATDAERELAPSGLADAAAAGEWLRGRGLVPDCAVVSAATRTRQTWSALAQAADWAVEPTFDRGLYAAGPDTALDLLRDLDDACSTVVLLGHNPTMASLAQLLDDGEGDVEAGNAMAVGFPTAALALFDVHGAWADLGAGAATVTGFHVARA